MRASVAFEDAVRRSLAATAGGFLVGGCLSAMDVFNERVLVLATMESAFLGTLALLLAYYHKRWMLGVLAVVIAVGTPFAATTLWVKFLSIPLIYLAGVLLLFGGAILEIAHRKIAGPQPEDELEEQAIRAMIDHFKPTNITWMDRTTWLCITASLIILLFLWLR